MVITGLLSIIAGLPFGAIFFEWQDGFDATRAKLSNLQAVVKVESVSQEAERICAINESEQKRKFVSVKCTVLDGQGAQKDQKLTVLIGSTDQGRQEARPAPKKDSKYFLVGYKPENNVLAFINGRPEFGNTIFTKREDPSEIVGLMMLPTAKEALSVRETTVETIVSTAIDCLESSGELDSFRVCRFLKYCPPKTVVRPDNYTKVMTAYCPETEQTKKLFELAKKSPPMRKSFIYRLLVSWRVSGAEIKYRDSLVALSLDPSAYKDEIYRLDIDRNQFAANDIDGPPRFEAEEWLKVLFNSRNDFLCAYFADKYGAILDERQTARFALLLNHRSADVRYHVAKELSYQFNDTEHRPKAYGSVNHREVPYPNLDEIVAYWREKFGIKPPN